MRLFRALLPAITVSLLISDVLLSLAGFVLAVRIALQVEPTVYLVYESGLTKILIAVGSFLLGLYFQDLYSQVRIKSKILLALQVCSALGAAFLLQALISYLKLDLRLAAPVMMLGAILTGTSVFLWRLCFSALVLRAGGGERLLLIGNSPLLSDIARYLEEHPTAGLAILGRLEEPDGPSEPIDGIKSLGAISDLTEVVRAARPDRIVVGMFERRDRLPVNELLEARMDGCIVEESGVAYERICKRVCIRGLRPSQLIYSGELGPRPRYLSLQRVLNVAFSAVVLALLLPVAVVTALAVALSSPGPVLYRQVRVGRKGAPFTLYKFRSMRNNAEAKTGAVWASRDDPRITRVGRIIRKLRIDELPQLFNVLKGEMSIVGPRPERPEFVQTLSRQIPYYTQRSCVRPGITGWAQINYKYGDTIEDTIKKLEYDLFYIKHMSLVLDIYIALHTVKAMLLSEGAQ